MDYTRKRTLISSLNAINFVGLEGIKCGNVLQLYINNEKKSTRCMLYPAIERMIACFFKYDYYVMGTGKILFLFLSNNFANPHAFDIMQKIANLAPSKIELHAVNKKKFNNYLYKFYLVFLWIHQMSGINLSLGEKSYLGVLLFHAYTEMKWILSKIKTKEISLVASIHDVRMEDNLIVQYFNSINVDTVALAHGSFRMPMDEFDYICSVSKYYMVVDSFMYADALKLGMPTSKLIKVCLPQYLGKERQSLQFEISSQNKFGVYLSHPDEKKNNMMLLQYADELASYINAVYYVKIHPSDNMENYVWNNDPKRCICILDSQTEEKDIQKEIKFAVVGFRSKMFLEMFYNGKVALRYVPKAEEDVYLDIQCWKFGNASELIKEYIKCSKTDYIDQAVKEIESKYLSSEYSEKSYIRFFEKYT